MFPPFSVEDQSTQQSCNLMVEFEQKLVDWEEKAFKHE
jgi:hypothetical protein